MHLSKNGEPPLSRVTAGVDRPGLPGLPGALLAAQRASPPPALPPPRPRTAPASGSARPMPCLSQHSYFKRILAALLRSYQCRPPSMQSSENQGLETTGLSDFPVLTRNPLWWSLSSAVPLPTRSWDAAAFLGGARVRRPNIEPAHDSFVCRFRVLRLSLP